MINITFNFDDQSIESVKLSKDYFGQSILDIALENDIILHHNCGGVCACSTCHLYVMQGGDHLKEITDREEDFIDRARNPRLESRLACQCEILSHAAEITITIPDQKLITGH